jgi:hypothetical protein
LDKFGHPERTVLVVKMILCAALTSNFRGIEAPGPLVDPQVVDRFSMTWAEDDQLSIGRGRDRNGRRCSRMPRKSEVSAKEEDGPFRTPYKDEWVKAPSSEVYMNLDLLL